jgi:hypothetical protein
MVKTRQPPQQQPLADWAKPSGGSASISELARSSGLDRATVVKRLEAAGLQPKQTRHNEKLFELTAALAALATRPNEVSEYNRARTQKTTAQAALALLRLQRERGELVPIKDLREQVYLLIKAIHERITRYPRAARGRLHRAQNVSELERIMMADFDRIFNEIKRDYPNMF